MASVLLVASSSYCFSDTTYGVTGNAAGSGLTWGMDGVLPDYSQPWVSLQVMGLAYRYTMVKDPDTGVTVWVRNEDAIDGGYVFEERDDWNGSGGTIQKYFRFPYKDASRWGQGSIDIEGEGTIENPVVTYNYKMDVDDELMKCMVTPLADPACPGFAEALVDLLKSIDQMMPGDPFYDEWVQAQLNQEVEEQEETEVEEPEEVLANFEKQMGGENTIEQLGGNQADLLAELAQVPKIEPYYMIQIDGGVYEETIQLQDATIIDNKGALRNLASDANHRKMVRSQYDR